MIRIKSFQAEEFYIKVISQKINVNMNKKSQRNLQREITDTFPDLFIVVALTLAKETTKAGCMSFILIADYGVHKIQKSEQFIYLHKSNKRQNMNFCKVKDLIKGKLVKKLSGNKQ